MPLVKPVTVAVTSGDDGRANAVHEAPASDEYSMAYVVIAAPPLSDEPVQVRFTDWLSVVPDSDVGAVGVVRGVRGSETTETPLRPASLSA